jgi:hypothetical protein
MCRNERFLIREFLSPQLKGIVAFLSKVSGNGFPSSVTKPLAKRGYICFRKSAKLYEAENPQAAG